MKVELRERGDHEDRERRSKEELEELDQEQQGRWPNMLNRMALFKHFGALASRRTRSLSFVQLI